MNIRQVRYICRYKVFVLFSSTVIYINGYVNFYDYVLPYCRYLLLIILSLNQYRHKPFYNNVKRFLRRKLFECFFLLLPLSGQEYRHPHEYPSYKNYRRKNVIHQLLGYLRESRIKCLLLYHCQLVKVFSLAS